MSSPPRSSREEEQRLNLRTLVIASAASATAALVTSRLWIAGTWIAAAMTPVLVTLVSEMLRRPTDRIARGITLDRPALPDPEAPPAPAGAIRPEAAAAQRVADRLREADAPLPDPEAPARGGASEPGARPLGEPAAGAPPAPTRVYRSESARRAPRRRKIAYGVVLGTAAIAFAIGVLTLTLGELIGGGSAGNNDRRTTLIGGSTGKRDSSEQEAPRQTTTESTETEQQSTTTEQQPTTPETETTTTPATPAPTGEPAPSETTPTTPTQP
jgi:hypothetical protein